MEEAITGWAHTTERRIVKAKLLCYRRYTDPDGPDRKTVVLNCTLKSSHVSLWLYLGFFRDRWWVHLGELNKRIGRSTAEIAIDLMKPLGVVIVQPLVEAGVEFIERGIEFALACIIKELFFDNAAESHRCDDAVVEPLSTRLPLRFASNTTTRLL